MQLKMINKLHANSLAGVPSSRLELSVRTAPSLTLLALPLGVVLPLIPLVDELNEVDDEIEPLGELSFFVCVVKYSQ